MSQELQARSDLGEIEKVLVTGDLKALTPEQRTRYYQQVCQSLGLNPLTKPFDYLVLNNKLVLYANRNCAEQLRRVYSVSIVEMSQQVHEGIVTTIVKGRDSAGREDMASASVVLAGLKGEALANAYMKAETKAKRRLTLSMCGLGMLDETEVESIPNAQRVAEPDMPPPALPASEPEKPKATPFGTLVGNAAKASGIPVQEFVGILFDKMAEFYPRLEDARSKTWKEYGAEMGSIYAASDEDDRIGIDEMIKMVPQWKTELAAQASE